ncbi:hypothetical protein C8R43DRAFT_1142069 [Mycena crocata]|nr:hypothetical protein C8R43DRAFT_1142069 [Mycena crocata]
MNRLKKPNQSPHKPITSDTLNNVMTIRPTLSTIEASPHGQSRTLSAAYESVLRPRTNAEQYWVARALTAETLLAARLEHHRDLRLLSYAEEHKRARELAVYDARHVKLERLVLALLVTLLLLVFALLKFARDAATQASRIRKLPTHFTIPILSPWTSVVEHETSVVGSKTLAVFALALTVLAYFVFRHWLSRHQY